MTLPLPYLLIQEIYLTKELNSGLMDLDLSDNSKNCIHAQFVNGGIKRAARKLCRKEKQAVNVMAFSVGGVIAWKAALQVLPVKRLYAISATRLRYETKKPDCKCTLYFGEEDGYKPTVNWHFRE